MSAAASVHVCSSAGEMFHRAANQLCAIARTAIDERSRFVVALSGGSTPRALFNCLASEHGTDIDWSNVLFFWSDERTVPPEHDDSNYRMARDTLLRPLGIEDGQIFRLHGEDDPHAAASAYEETIAKVFDLNNFSQPPSFDLVLLGIGYDGHTASLFPNTQALVETTRWVVANEVSKLNTWRLTMTPSLINAARHVVFLATGANKAQAVSQVIGGSRKPEDHPGQLVWPKDGTLTWYLDRAAAGKLKQA